MSKPDAPLLVTSAIQQQLEILGGLPLNSTTLHHVPSGYTCHASLVWQVGYRYIRMQPVEHEDLRMPLEHFTAKYLTDPVRVMKEGDGG